MGQKGHKKERKKKEEREIKSRETTGGADDARVIMSGGESNDMRNSLAGCLVEDQDVALAKKSTGKTEELLLAMRQVDLIDVGV